MEIPARGPERLFAVVTGRIHSWLPAALKKVLPQTFIGFAILGLTTFSFDMLLLSIFHGVFKMNYPFAVTLGYVLASIASFLLNKWLNFHAHGNVGAQSARYVFVMVSNYVIWILVFSSILEKIGVQYQLSRFIAACVEGIYIYVLMRWWVFREVRNKEPEVTPESASPPAERQAVTVPDSRD